MGYNAYIGASYSYPGAQPIANTPWPGIGPASETQIDAPARKLLLLHNAGPYSKNAEFHAHEGNEFMRNTAAGGANPFKDGMDWSLQVHPHSDGANIVFADGHVKWYSRVNPINGSAGFSTATSNSWNTSVIDYGYWYPNCASAIAAGFTGKCTS